jgi:cell wall-associated NlpC family hydrolase
MMSGKTIAQRMAVLTATVAMALPLAQSADAATNYGPAIVATAKSKVGDPYDYGAVGPNSFDCSGLVVYSSKRAGYPYASRWWFRTAQEQYDNSKYISWSNRKPGDFVFFHDSSGYVFHVGIYVGVRYHWGAYRSFMIHAPRPGTDVKYEDIYENWGYSYVTYGRI